VVPARSDPNAPPVNDPRTSDLTRLLARRPPRLISSDATLQRAAVSLIVRTADPHLEILFIERPISPTDPWSGHIAFPGGRRSGEEDDRNTAVRETLEEVGIDLIEVGTYLGRLDDIQPARGGPRLAVAALVFAVPEDVVVRPQPREVARVMWIPVSHLADPQAAAEHLLVLERGEQLSFPAVAYHGHVIWGLTYRMLMQFLEIVRMADKEAET
jgi:8-oxo-dGTP pyrophosphatase MutT (NUDIX family)